MVSPVDHLDCRRVVRTNKRLIAVEIPIVPDEVGLNSITSKFPNGIGGSTNHDALGGQVKSGGEVIPIMRADHIALARPLLDYRRWGLCGPVRINAAGTTHFEPGGVSFTILIYVHRVPCAIRRRGNTSTRFSNPPHPRRRTCSRRAWFGGASTASTHIRHRRSGT